MLFISWAFSFIMSSELELVGGTCYFFDVSTSAITIVLCKEMAILSFGLSELDQLGIITQRAKEKLLKQGIGSVVERTAKLLVGC